MGKTGEIQSLELVNRAAPVFLNFFFFFVFFSFLGPLPQHMGVPRLGVESELPQPTEQGQGLNPQPHGS